MSTVSPNPQLFISNSCDMTSADTPAGGDIYDAVVDGTTVTLVYEGTGVDAGTWVEPFVHYDI